MVSFINPPSLWLLSHCLIKVSVLQTEYTVRCDNLILSLLNNLTFLLFLLILQNIHFLDWRCHYSSYVISLSVFISIYLIYKLWERELESTICGPIGTQLCYFSWPSLKQTFKYEVPGSLSGCLLSPPPVLKVHIELCAVQTCLFISTKYLYKFIDHI